MRHPGGLQRVNSATARPLRKVTPAPCGSNRLQVEVPGLGAAVPADAVARSPRGAYLRPRRSQREPAERPARDDETGARRSGRAAGATSSGPGRPISARREPHHSESAQVREHPDRRLVATAARPGEAHAQRGGVVLVAQLPQGHVPVRPVHEDVGPGRDAGHVEVLAVEVGGIAVRVADRGSLFDGEGARLELLAVRVEYRVPRLARDPPGNERPVVGETEAGLAVGDDQRVVARPPQLVALEVHQVPVLVRRGDRVLEEPDVRIRLCAAADQPHSSARRASSARRGSDVRRRSKAVPRRRCRVADVKPRR